MPCVEDCKGNHGERRAVPLDGLLVHPRDVAGIVLKGPASECAEDDVADDIRDQRGKLRLHTLFHLTQIARVGRLALPAAIDGRRTQLQKGEDLIGGQEGIAQGRCVVVLLPATNADQRRRRQVDPPILSGDEVVSRLLRVVGALRRLLSANVRAADRQGRGCARLLWQRSSVGAPSR